MDAMFPYYIIFLLPQELVGGHYREWVSQLQKEASSNFQTITSSVASMKTFIQY